MPCYPFLFKGVSPLRFTKYIAQTLSHIRVGQEEGRGVNFWSGGIDIADNFHVLQRLAKRVHTCPLQDE